MNNDTAAASNIENVSNELKVFEMQEKTVISIMPSNMVDIEKISELHNKKEKINIYDISKRLLDVILSLFALIVFLPIFILI